MEKMWLAFCKARYPGLVIGSMEYDERRHCFFAGTYTVLRMLQKCPESAIDALITDVSNEVKAELTRDPKAAIVINLLG